MALITNLQYIIDNQEVASTIKIILCTAKLTDGSQIFNSNVGTICTVFSRQDTANSSDAIQFPKRFRNANKADIFVVMPKKEDLGIDIQGFIDLQKKDFLACKLFAKKVNNEADISGLDEINFDIKKGTFSGKLNKDSEYDSLQALFHVRKKHNQRLCKRSLEAEIKDIAPYFTFEPIELGSNENVDFGQLADIKQTEKEHSKYRKEISLRACEDDLYRIANVCEGLVKEKDKQKDIAKFLKSEQKRNGVDRLDTAVQDFVKPFLSSILVILLDFIKVHNFLKGLASKEQIFNIISNKRFKHFFQTVKFHTIMYCMNEGIKPKWKVNKEDMFWAKLMAQTKDKLLEHHYQKELTATELYRVVGCKDLDFRNLNKFVTILSNGQITQSKSNGITKYHINLSGGIDDVLGSFDLHMGVTQGHQIDIFDFGNCEIDCPF